MSGLVTSFDVHHQLCWLTLGTSKGAHICWDMRFQLPVAIVPHPTGNMSSSFIIRYNCSVGYFKENLKIQTDTLPSPPVPAPSLRSRSPLLQLGGLEKRCQLPSKVGAPILVHFSLKI